MHIQVYKLNIKMKDNCRFFENFSIPDIWIETDWWYKQVTELQEYKDFLLKTWLDEWEELIKRINFHLWIKYKDV